MKHPGCFESSRGAIASALSAGSASFTRRVAVFGRHDLLAEDHPGRDHEVRVRREGLLPADHPARSGRGRVHASLAYGCVVARSRSFPGEHPHPSASRRAALVARLRVRASLELEAARSVPIGAASFRREGRRSHLAVCPRHAADQLHRVEDRLHLVGGRNRRVAVRPDHVLRDRQDRRDDRRLRFQPFPGP